MLQLRRMLMKWRFENTWVYLTVFLYFDIAHVLLILVINKLE